MGKRLKKANQIIDKEKLHSLDSAIQLLCNDYAKTSKAKFDETLDIVFNLGINTKKPDQIVKGAVFTPHSLRKKVKILAVVNEQSVQIAKDAGADLAGSNEIIDQIQDGLTDFNCCVTTPDMMPKLGRVAKVLGPKGLMPTLGMGTVCDNVTKLIKQIKHGHIGFKADKNGIIHAGIAKISYPKEAIKENIITLYKGIMDAKPEKIKNNYINRIFLSTTQGISIQLDLNSIVV